MSQLGKFHADQTSGRVPTVSHIPLSEGNITETLESIDNHYTKKMTALVVQMAKIMCLHFA